MTRRGNVRGRGGRAGSAEVSDHQEHEDAGQQHAADHDELILRGPSLDESHHRVGQAQHVGHVQHLLVGPLQTAHTATQGVTTLHRGAVIICGSFVF